jgi:hypothetical protein
MSSVFGDVIYYFVLLVGTITAVLSFAFAISDYRERRSKLQRAQERRFRKAIESDDLTVIGNYLYKVIGSFNVHEYVTNKDISNRVDKYVDRLREFLGTEEEIKSQRADIKERPIPERLIAPSVELGSISDKLASGDTWSALAQLRRHIEITLREVARANDVSVKITAGAGYLLKLLFDRRIISGQTFSDLKYAIAVSNRAIHGLDVEIDEAKRAVILAFNCINELKQ